MGTPVSSSVHRAIAFLGSRRVGLIDVPDDLSPLAPDAVAGRTVVTLVSPGTELNWGFDAPLDAPRIGGYAAVFEVEAVGAAVTDVRPGQLVLAMGRHEARQRRARNTVVPVPEGLSPEVATFARLMGVSWTTLTTTRARPADRVLITGLGPVGNLAAQMFQVAGYRVTAVDPIAERRDLAGRCGVRDVRAAALGQADLVDQVALAVECSGHEQATIDCCRVVRKGGEVVLVGVPWRKNVDTPVFEITHAVFHRYIHLRSGWEWELPWHATDFAAGNLMGNLAAATAWLADGRVKVDGLFSVASPEEAQAIYSGLFERRSPAPTAVFDWRKLG